MGAQIKVQNNAFVNDMLSYTLRKKVFSDCKKDIEEMEKEIEIKVTEKLVKKVASAFIVAIHDTYNFKHKRMDRILKKAEEVFRCLDYEGSELTLDDTLQWCKDELKIEL